MTATASLPRCIKMNFVCICSIAMNSISCPGVFVLVAAVGAGSEVLQQHSIMRGSSWSAAACSSKERLASSDVCAMMQQQYQPSGLPQVCAAVAGWWSSTTRRIAHKSASGQDFRQATQAFADMRKFTAHLLLLSDFVAQSWLKLYADTNYSRATKAYNCGHSTGDSHCCIV